MNRVLLSRRVLESAGVVAVFTMLESAHPFHSYTPPPDDSRFENLKKFRRSVAEECVEAIEKLNRNFFCEVERVHRDCGVKENMHEWLEKEMKVLDFELPLKYSESSRHAEVIDRLRLFPRDTLDKSLRLPHYSEKYKNNSRIALKCLVDDYNSVESEVLLTYMTKQKQVSDIIESHRSKLYVDQSNASAFSPSTFPFAGSLLFLSALRKLWPIPHDAVGSQLQKKISVLGLVLFGMSVYALYYNEDKEVNDYSVEKSYEDAEVPLPTSFRLPPLQYSGVIPLKYRPGQHVDDRLSVSYLSEIFYSTVVDAIVFRNILFKSLSLYSSAAVAHVFTAGAAVITAGFRNYSAESYHSIVDDDENAAISAEDEVTRTLSFPMPLEPIFLQLMLYSTGRLSLTLLADLAMRIRKEVNFESLVNNESFVMFRQFSVYKAGCELVAGFDWITEPLYNFLHSFSRDNGLYSAVASDIVEKYAKLHGVSESFSTDDIVALEKSVLFCSQSFRFPLDTLIPPPFDPARMKKQKFFGPDESKLLRSISGIDNESYALVTSFVEDCEEALFNRYHGGNVDLALSKKMVRHSILEKEWPSGSDEKEFEKRVLFWEQHASEENVLDLVQELNEFLYAKMLIHLDTYRSTYGKYYMMELESEPFIYRKDFKLYYQQLRVWLTEATNLDAQNYLNRYGLTLSRYNFIVEKWSPAKDLQKNWFNFFRSDKCSALVRERANPLQFRRKNSQT